MPTRSATLRVVAETKRTILERIDVNLRALLSLFPVKLRLRFGTPEAREDTPRGFPMADKTLTDIQKVTVTLVGLDAAGNDVPLDFPTPPTWQSSDATVVTVTPADNGVTAVIATTGKLGGAEVTVKGTTADNREITGIGTLDVVTSAPATFRLAFGDAESR